MPVREAAWNDLAGPWITRSSALQENMHSLKFSQHPYNQRLLFVLHSLISLSTTTHSIKVNNYEHIWTDHHKIMFWFFLAPRLPCRHQIYFSRCILCQFLLQHHFLPLSGGEGGCVDVPATLQGGPRESWCSAQHKPG